VDAPIQNHICNYLYLQLHGHVGPTHIVTNLVGLDNNHIVVKKLVGMDKVSSNVTKINIGRRFGLSHQCYLNYIHALNSPTKLKFKVKLTLG
jgi:hypothetical protein